MQLGIVVLRDVLQLIYAQHLFTADAHSYVLTAKESIMLTCLIDFLELWLFIRVIVVNIKSRLNIK